MKTQKVAAQSLQPAAYAIHMGMSEVSFDSGSSLFPMPYIYILFVCINLI